LTFLKSALYIKIMLQAKLN